MQSELGACKFMVQHLPSKHNPVNLIIISSKSAQNILIKVFLRAGHALFSTGESEYLQIVRTKLTLSPCAFIVATSLNLKSSSDCQLNSLV